MLSAIGHRGPDDSGEYFDDDVQIAVARLAIVDLKGGAQPVRSKRGSVSALNGEIYNHLELRRELRPISFVSDSDSAVILPAFERWGPQAVEHLRGMFSIAVWDRNSRQLVLARDRFGIKPLYIAVTNDFLVFGSEIKAILASKLVEARISSQSLDDLFTLSYPCPPHTMFEGVSEVPPGTLIEYQARSQREKVSRYWHAPFAENGAHSKISYGDACENLRELLRSSVYEHLQADVPIATYLSGGIDSSAIAALVREVTGDAPTTFSIGFDASELDEREYAQSAADHLGSENHLLVCDRSTADLLPAVVRSMELPLQFPLALPYHALARMVRERGFKVALTGEGADEIFGGYDGFRADKMRRVFDPRPLSWLQPIAYRNIYRWRRMPSGMIDLMLSNHSRADQVASKYFGHFPIWYDLWSILEPDRVSLMARNRADVRELDCPPSGLEKRLPANYKALHPLDAALSAELSTRLPSWILQIGDRSAMAHGVESRVPFLDHRIVDFVAPLPPSYKVRRFKEKAILRNAVADLLPKRLANRPKRPFYTPIRDWFFSETAPEYARHVIAPAAINSAGLFSSASVAELKSNLDRHSSDTVAGLRAEWLLMLVLGCQVLHDQFVQELP